MSMLFAPLSGLGGWGAGPVDESHLPGWPDRRVYALGKRVGTSVWNVLLSLFSCTERLPDS